MKITICSQPSHNTTLLLGNTKSNNDVKRSRLQNISTQPWKTSPAVLRHVSVLSLKPQGHSVTLATWEHHRPPRFRRKTILEFRLKKYHVRFQTRSGLGRVRKKSVRETDEVFVVSVTEKSIHGTDPAAQNHLGQTWRPYLARGQTHGAGQSCLVFFSNGQALGESCWHIPTHTFTPVKPLKVFYRLTKLQLIW